VLTPKVQSFCEHYNEAALVRSAGNSL